MPTKDDWTAWHEERGRFLARETKGFSKDLEALEQHIKNLTELAPKDKAGWPVVTALIAIGRLQKDYSRFKDYLELSKDLI